VDAQYFQAIASVLPKVSIAASATTKKDAANSAAAAFGGEAYNYYSTSISATQPIFDGGGMFYAFPIARQQVAIKNLELEIAERDLADQVISRFYSLLWYERQLELLRKTEEVMQKMLATAQARLKIGRSQLLDVLNIKSDLAGLAPKLVRAKADQEIAAASLASLMGEKEKKTIEIHGKLEFPAVQSLMKQAATRKARVPELEKAATLIEQFGNTRKAIMGKHLPTLNVVGSISRAATNKVDMLDPYSTAWSVGLQLSIPVFSGLSSIFDRRQLSSQEAQMRIQEDGIRDAKALGQIQSERDLRAALEVVDSSREAAKLAHESFREAERSFKISTTDYLTYLKSTNGYFNAEMALEFARFDLLRSLSKYYIYSGFPISELVDELEKAGGV